MAVSITPDFAGTTCYTHQLQHLQVFATSLKIQFAVYKVNQDQYNTRNKIFESEYQSYHNGYDIYDIGEVIEQYMHANGGYVAQFALVATNPQNTTDKAELLLWVVHCKNLKTDISAADLLDSHFISNRTSRLTYSNAEEWITVFVPYGSVGGYTFFTYHRQIVYRRRNGSVETATNTNRQRVGYGFQHIDVSPRTMFQLVQYQVPDIEAVLSYTITYRGQTARFYVSDLNTFRSFLYTNPFGALEFIHIPTEQTLTVKTKSSTAQCGDEIALYDVQHTRTYEEQTQVLTFQDALMMEDFLTSPSVMLYVNGMPKAVVITDYTLEVSDNPGTDNKVKFTWQFANARQTLPRQDYQRIFQEPYAEQYQ